MVSAPWNQESPRSANGFLGMTQGSIQSVKDETQVASADGPFPAGLGETERWRDAGAVPQ